MAPLRALATRRLLWILVYGALAAGSAYALWRIPVEVLPAFDYPQVAVVAHAPGETAGTLETRVARPLEGRLLALPDVASVRSASSQGTVEVDVRFRSGTGAQADLQAVEGALGRARPDLPSGIDPYAEVMGNADNEVADDALVLPPDHTAAEVARDVRVRILPALRALPGVQRVTLSGAGNEALWVAPDETALQRTGASLGDLEAALRQAVILGPAGWQRLGHQDVFATVRSLPTTAAALRQLPVRAGAKGDHRVPLGDLARVSSRATPIHDAVLLDGRPALGLVVFKQPGASTLPVTRAVARTLDGLAGQLPEGARWVPVYSQGHVVGLIGSDLGRNLLVGGLLAILVLLWILGRRRGVWLLAASIPLSIGLAVAGLLATGHSLNLLTLGALTVAVGLVADDSIIVLESIEHRLEAGEGGAAAAWQGLRDIAAPDVTGTLTVVAVYLPLLLVGGLTGLFFRPFAWAMGLALLASLVVSLTLIPVALAGRRAAGASRAGRGGALLHGLRRGNERLLQVTLAHPWWSLGACLALLLGSVGVVLGVPVDFLPLPNEGVLLDSFALPPGTALEDTRAAVGRIIRRLQADPAVAHVYARIGSAAGTGYTEPSDAGEIQVVLRPGVRTGRLDAVAARLGREAHQTGVEQSFDTPTVERVGESLSGLPQPFVVRVVGNDVATLRTLAEAVTRRLRKVPALAGVTDDDGYPVDHLRVTPRLARLAARGLSARDLEAQLAPALAGRVVARVPQGGWHLDLYLRLAGAPALGLAGLRALPVRTSTGFAPLGSLARVEVVTGPNRIRHVDGSRAMEILATPLGPLGATERAARRALAGLPLPAGYRVAFGGLLPRLERAAALTAAAAGLALLLVLAILLVQFDRLRTVGILLLQVPLTFTGGMLALGLGGVGLNATGVVGFLTLVGIGLNHDIVLLHRASRNEAAGMDPEAAIREAVAVRFRPIVLTTLTAVLGMLPTALGWGVGAAPEQGMALVILGGVVWSSVLSTNLIPALWLRSRRRPPPEAAAG